MEETPGVAPGGAVPDPGTATPETAVGEARSDEAAQDTAQLLAVREALLRAYPDVVPELVGGESVEALLASLEPAAAAYQRLAAGLAQRATPAAPTAPVVPAGSVAPVVFDLDRLPAVEKIRQALAREGRRPAGLGE